MDVVLCWDGTLCFTPSCGSLGRSFIKPGMFVVGMGISTVVAGLSESDIADLIRNILKESGGVQIGTSDVGLEVHTSPGEARNGDFINEDAWIEIYGKQVVFSETQQ